MHTKEPWKFIDVIGGCSVYAGRIEILSYHYSPDSESMANARRIVACVNACAGIPTEQLAGVSVYERQQSFRRDYQEMKQQRDELLAVLKIIDERFGKCRDQYIFSKRIALDKVRNVIAKCES